MEKPPHHGLWLELCGHSKLKLLEILRNITHLQIYSVTERELYPRFRLMVMFPDFQVSGRQLDM